MKPIGRYTSLALALTVAFALAAVPAGAGEIDREFPFELDTWYELDYSEGPITVHRVRVEVQTGNVKSKVFRPTNSEWLETVQIQIEYTNDSKNDVDADLDVYWTDAAGTEIDGYREEEDMDGEEHDEMTAVLSTLKYGLDKAKTLHVGIRF